MDQAAAFTPHAWESFYVIVGSTAGALIGLQFVVLTLITEAGMIRGSGETLAAFGSPNVVHFCAALLVSAVFSAPWHGMGGPAITVVLAGVCGMIYSIAVLRRALRQRDYKPVLEDWIWHAALPMIAYAAQVYSGVQLTQLHPDALFIVGGSALLLVFIGIHNAWDTVTYVTMERARERKAKRAATHPDEGAAASTSSSSPPTASDNASVHS